MRRLDRAIGIGLGVLLGIGIVVVFVFFGSEGTIDAPRIDQGQTTQAPVGHANRDHRPPKPKPSRTPPPATVTIAGGAPPSSGPPHLDYHEGDSVRLRVSSDSTVEVELLGYGITTTVEAGVPQQISFTASKTGNFPLIVTASHIAVAEIRVDQR